MVDYTQIRQVIALEKNNALDLSEFIKFVEPYTVDNGRSLHLVVIESLKHFRQKALQLVTDILKNTKAKCDKKKSNIKMKYEGDIRKLNTAKDNALKYIRNEHPKFKIDEVLDNELQEDRIKSSSRFNANNGLHQYNELYTKLLQRQKSQKKLENKIKKMYVILDHLQNSLLCEILEYRDLMEVETTLRNEVYSLKKRLETSPKNNRKPTEPRKTLRKSESFSRFFGSHPNEIIDSINLESDDTFTDLDPSVNSTSSFGSIDFRSCDSMVESVESWLKTTTLDFE